MSQSKIQALLLNHQVCIAYEPLRDEINPSFLLNMHQTCQRITVPTNPDTDPVLYARRCIKSCGDQQTCVLLPGTAFDLSGNRIGRGGGWYDRFLSRIPSRWIRIGVTAEKNISKKTIQAHPWDEPVDFLIIVHSNVDVSYHETHARFDK